MSREANATLSLKICVSIGALVVAAVHQWTPIRLDTVTIVLLVVALMPWLQPLVKSIELWGMKLEMQALQEKVADAKGAAQSATRQAFFAQSASGPNADAAETPLMALADEYDRIRSTQTRGDARTLAMTRVVHKIAELAPRHQDFDVAAALADKRRGVRLVAYGLLYGAPNPGQLEALVKSVTTLEDKPFGQYWGLQAIARIIDTIASASAVPSYVITQLKEFSTRVPRGTDRDYELRKVLERFGGKSIAS